MSELQSDILKTCLRLSNTVNETEKVVDFDLNRLSPVSALYCRVVCAAGKIIKSYVPFRDINNSVIIPVPVRSNRIAGDIGRNTGIHAVRLAFDAKTSDISFPAHTYSAVMGSKSVILFEDVRSDSKGIEQLLVVDGIAERTKAIVSIWDRRSLNAQADAKSDADKTTTEKTLPITERSVVSLEIPPVIASLSEFIEQSAT